MGVPIGLVRHQRAVLRGMGEVALASLLPGPLRGAPPTPPGEWIERRVAPLPDALLDAFAEHVGAGDGYRGLVPPTLFPHWAFPMSGRLLRGVRQPLLRAMNGGCRLEVRGAIPRGRELVVRGRLVAIDDDGRRAVITERFTTGIEGATNLLLAEVRIFVPLARKKRRDEEAPRALEGSVELGRCALGPRAGWEFALLTGDFNPVHWVRRYARANGFRDVILHGFGTFARVWEVLRTARAFRAIDARFTRPLVLPNEVRVLAEDGRIAVLDREGSVVMRGTIES